MRLFGTASVILDSVSFRFPQLSGVRLQHPQDRTDPTRMMIWQSADCWTLTSTARAIGPSFCISTDLLLDCHLAASEYDCRQQYSPQSVLHQGSQIHQLLLPPLQNTVVSNGKTANL